MQNSFKRDAIHTVHTTECMQKTRFQLRKPRGKKKEKKKEKTGRNSCRRRSPAICPRIFLSSYPYCRRVQCLVETLQNSTKASEPQGTDPRLHSRKNEHEERKKKY
jgi:hypothetical protein